MAGRHGQERRGAAAAVAAQPGGAHGADEPHVPLAARFGVNWDVLPREVRGPWKGFDRILGCTALLGATLQQLTVEGVIWDVLPREVQRKR